LAKGSKAEISCGDSVQFRLDGRIQERRFAGINGG
jgi:hypothetical protein